MSTKDQKYTSHATKLDEKVANFSYEEARAKLVEIVSRLEQGNIPLEESIALWELGEALARRCESWLTGARERLAQAQNNVANTVENTESVEKEPTISESADISENTCRPDSEK